MPNPLIALIEKHAGPDFVPRLKQQVMGLAEDFWKDPACDFPVIGIKLGKREFGIPNWFKPIPRDAPAESAAPVVAEIAPTAKAPPPIWHAKAGEVAEKMWGDGQILPAGDAVLDMLVAPLKLGKEKFVLDLTAGLGGPLRKLSAKIHELKGFEADPDIAARAMEINAAEGKAKQVPIAAYDPNKFSMPAIYHCMIARELFYRIHDKAQFFYSISAGIKFGGEVAFTDYIVDPENRDKPAIAAWKANEPGAVPLGLIEMAQAWAAVGFEMKASEDQTAFYKREVLQGLNRLVTSLRSNGVPDTATKNMILHETQTWVHRMAAVDQGMKFYRFHAIKS